MAGTGDLAELSDGELETELCTLAARVAAATCRFLLAVAEYDRRRGWESWECHDMASWLSWKCGISPVTAREQVRVARALERLPLLRERFVSGRLSYSQARAIARSATPATEATLVEFAGSATAAQLEQITRAYRRSRQAADEDERHRDIHRHLSYHWDDQGNLVGRFSLPAEAGAILIKALETNIDQSALGEADAGGARDPWSAARADTLVELVASGAQALAARDGEGDGGDDSGFLLTLVVEESALAADGPGGDEIGLCQVEDGPGVSAQTARRIACDASVVTVTEDGDGRILDLGRRTRRPNRTLKRALRHRDGTGCRYPGCDRAGRQAHHIHHWVDGGPTSLENLVLLCSRHHHLLHEGRFRMETDALGQPRFYHRDGQVITEGPQVGAAGSEDPADALSHLEPYAGGWDGTRLDLGLAIGCLVGQDSFDAADSAESTATHPVWDDTRDLQPLGATA